MIAWHGEAFLVRGDDERGAREQQQLAAAAKQSHAAHSHVLMQPDCVIHRCSAAATAVVGQHGGQDGVVRGAGQGIVLPVARILPQPAATLVPLDC